MLTHNRRTIEKERVVAERALELFLTSPGLAWGDAYTAATYERATSTARLEHALKLVAKGRTLEEAIRAVEPTDPRLPPARER